MLTLAVWWSWIYMAWLTNWFDPDRRPVRLMMIGAMLGSLLMAAMLPEAFGERGLAFAGAFESRVVTTIYLIGLHAIMGMASAGVALASGTIGLKLAPRGSARILLLGVKT